MHVLTQSAKKIGESITESVVVLSVTQYILIVYFMALIVSVLTFLRNRHSLTDIAAIGMVLIMCVVLPEVFSSTILEHEKNRHELRTNEWIQGDSWSFEREETTIESRTF